jgi:putative copper resistance protein D
MPLKPRIVLATLAVASMLGVSLTWSSTAASIVVPLASWVAIVSLGTLLTNGFLWHSYADKSETRPAWLVRRWARLGYLAGGGAVAGLTVRLASAADVMTPPQSVVVGIVTGTVVIGGIATGGQRSRDTGSPLSLVRSVAVAAGLGLVAIAWLDVAMESGAIGATIVRAVHLLAVGAWLGGAVWHNTLVVPALTASDATEIRPVVHRLQRIVPLLIVAVLLTGLHQSVTWLGTQLPTYLTTGVGQFIGVKLLAVALLAALVALSHVKRRTSRRSEH